jgi:hypothetical protein
VLLGLLVLVPVSAVRASGGAAPSDAATPRPVVVELFGSQGCASCRPAEALLARLSREPGVIALGFHVTYWDYIGWADPFADERFTERQRAYALRLDNRYVYTPQIVIDGREQVIGSREKAVARALGNARRSPPGVQPRFETGDGVRVVVPGAEISDRATVWLVYYDARHTTDIPRGENAGRTVTSHNVVRRFERLGTWSGKRAVFDLDALDARERGRTNCAVIVQKDGVGPILGAAMMPLPPEAG